VSQASEECAPQKVVATWVARVVCVNPEAPALRLAPHKGERDRMVPIPAPLWLELQPGVIDRPFVHLGQGPARVHRRHHVLAQQVDEGL